MKQYTHPWKEHPIGGRCPDFNVDGVWYEHEGYDENKDFSSHPKKRANTFSKMIKRGIKQSDRLIVEDCGVGYFFAKRSIYRRVRFEHQNISEVYVRTVTGLELLYKKEEDWRERQPAITESACAKSTLQIYNIFSIPQTFLQKKL